MLSLSSLSTVDLICLGDHGSLYKVYVDIGCPSDRVPPILS